MIDSSDFRFARIPLTHGSGQMPVIGFGTLIPDPAVTRTITGEALEIGYRHFDCAERYRNEREVGEALQAGSSAGGLRAKTSSLRRSCGTTIIGPSASSRLSKLVGTDSGSIMWIFI